MIQTTYLLLQVSSVVACIEASYPLTLLRDLREQARFRLC